MGHGRLNIGKRRAYLGALAILSAVGCHGANRDEGFGSLDANTRAMLLAPAGGSIKTPAQQYTVIDPTATGGKGLSAQNSFNRPMMGAQPNYSALADANSSASMPNTTGFVQTSVTAPTMPTTGGNLTLQSKVQPASYSAPATARPEYHQPPVTPLAPAVEPPTVKIIGEIPQNPPVVASAPAIQIIPDAPPPLPPSAPQPATMPVLSLPPVALQPVAAEPQPKPAGTLRTLSSPVAEPVPGLGVVAPGSLK